MPKLQTMNDRYTCPKCRRVSWLACYSPKWGEPEGYEFFCPGESKKILCTDGKGKDGKLDLGKATYVHFLSKTLWKKKENAVPRLWVRETK